MTEGSASVTARHALGHALREHRQRVGLSGIEVAARLGWSQAKISRIEKARVRAEVSDVQELIRLYDIKGKQRRSILDLAALAAGHRSEWRNSTRVGLPRRQQDFVALESAALSIRHYQTMLIPGPLQTRAYAEQVLSMVGHPDPERAIETRLARRSAILRPGGPSLQVLLTEMAVRWNPGSTELHQEQLETLVVIAKENHVDFRILPMGGQKRAFLAHPVVVYRFEDIDPLAIVEITTLDHRVTERADVARLEARLDVLARDSLSRQESIDLIGKLIESVG